MLDIYTASVILFFALLAVVIYWKRKNVDMKFILKVLPYFMWRTKRFMERVDSVAQISPRFWKGFYSVGAVVAVVLMVFGFFMILNSNYLVFSGKIDQPALQILLPTTGTSVSTGPGFILIPFWFWIIAIATILIPHELSHGIAARAEKIPLKSVGLLLFLIFPGAFVEPDEAKLKRAKLSTRLRVFAAGSFTNILTFFVILLIGTFFLFPMAAPGGVIVTNVFPGSPADSSGLKIGDTIEKFDGKDAKVSFFDYAMSYLLLMKNGTAEGQLQRLGGLQTISALSKHKPGETMNIVVNGQEKQIVLGENTDVKGFPYIGISSELKTENKAAFEVLLPLLSLIALLNLFVGIVNILPLYPLDGGLFFQALTQKFIPKRSEEIVKTFSYVILFLIIASVVGPYLFAAA